MGKRLSLTAFLLSAQPVFPSSDTEYLDIKSQETKGTFTSDAESEQRLLYYGQLDRRRHLSLEPTTPQVTHHRQVKASPMHDMHDLVFMQPEWGEVSRSAHRNRKSGTEL